MSTKDEVPAATLDPSPAAAPAQTPARTPAPVRRSRGSRLSRDDWAAAALEVLVADGIAGVDINAVCKHAGVTRGSFYWHFSDLGALHAAMAERWCAETREAMRNLAELDRLPPRERLQAMTLHLVDDSNWGVERALREWARSEPSVAEVIAEGDRFVFSLVEGALLELRGEASEARVLAGLLVYAGIGFAHGQAGLPKPTAEEIEELLRLVTG
ncbi:TetR/AcrR family transcriptional regulator [Nocardioides sp. zg-536]|uniref:TetR/AcrR family transcriptional regulator n=1 Tax=Nocardioides faecalis TaxID=2803858 RepID=A0A938YBU9_9ACTN|nr:TetR/AcrR family transcriptional regulator [Nocardioides faecalis]MBM9461121.1 TetR/AcrR family transcriptional regulator [Nocardioides faecalis]QVI58977.1 TetR/AcrR family transcriptional regulator [Nocardioides faecalis]